MKVSASAAVAVFSTVAVSSAINARQIDVVQGVLDDVSTDLTGLGSAVDSYDGSDSGPVVDAANTVVETINSGISTVEGSDDLSLEDALGLQEPVASLTELASGLVDNLTGKRDQIASAGECGTTRDLLSQIDTSSNNLIDAVVAKVPSGAQQIAEGLAADLRDVLSTANDNFSESNCVDSDDGGDDDAEPTPTGGDDEEPTAAPTGDDDAPAPTAEPTYVAPPPSGNHTTATPPPTAGAGAVLPAGALALGLAAALL